MSRALAIPLALLAGFTAGGSASNAADGGRKEANASDSSAIVLSLQLRGVGQLRFGQRFEWLLEASPPADLSGGDGIRQGQVTIRSVTDSVRHVLPEPPAYSRAEIGPACTVIRVRAYAVIRCLRDYVFDLRTGAPPVALDIQFNDRVSPPDRLMALPLPWWREVGYVLSGTDLLVLEYGWVNYGQGIESTEILKGPALLDLATGRLAIGYIGEGAEARIYDARADARSPNKIMLEEVIADQSMDGRRTVAVLTRFDSCAGARCRSEVDPAYRPSVPVVFMFD
jgi:hypothetical protein